MPARPPARGRPTGVRPPLQLCIELLGREEVTSDLLGSIRLLRDLPPRVLDALASRIVAGILIALRTNLAVIRTHDEWQARLSCADRVAARRNSLERGAAWCRHGATQWCNTWCSTVVQHMVQHMVQYSWCSTVVQHMVQQWLAAARARGEALASVHARGLQRGKVGVGSGLTPAHNCTRTGLTPAHICTGAGPAPAHICTRTVGPLHRGSQEVFGLLNIFLNKAETSACASDALVFLCSAQAPEGVVNAKNYLLFVDTLFKSARRLHVA